MSPVNTAFFLPFGWWDEGFELEPTEPFKTATECVSCGLTSVDFETDEENILLTSVISQSEASS